MTRICVAMLLSLVIQLSGGHENIDDLMDLIARTEKEIRDLKAEVQHVETKVATKIRMLNLMLRADLKKLVPGDVHSQSEVSWTHILPQKSINAMVNSHVMSEMRQVKLEHEQMKTEINSLFRQVRTAMKTGDPHPSVKSVQREPSADPRVQQTDLNQTDAVISSLQQDVRSLTDQVVRLRHSCQTQVTERERLESSVGKLRMNIDHLETETENLRVAFDTLNGSHVTNIDIVRNFHDEYIKTESPEESTLGYQVNVNGTPGLGSTSPSVSSFTTMRTTSSTPRPTSHSRESMTRILVSQIYSNTTKHAKQINIQNHSMTSYHYLNTRHVWSMVSDPISRRLIYSMYSPDGIFSTPLDAPGKPITLRAGVASYGMTIDVKRRLIFFTGGPKSTISRMSVWGKKYRRIAYMKNTETYGSNSALGIAVDTRRKMIYFGKYDGLWSVGYKGDNLRRLKSGKDLLGVTVDGVRNILYFGEGKKVMKMSLSTDVITQIKEVSGYIFNVVFYKDSLYIVTFGEGGVDIVHLNNDSHVHFDLEKKRYERNVICLLP
ncbi:uncharacterized protein [Haliotis asinina]|uniref:uncharacterized protein n=1 Tax=Haliotis asinina TaxID=109174 RepID=UPI003532068F